MITNHIQVKYKDNEIEEFDVYYSACDYTIETGDIKITMDSIHFEELRTKMNKLHEEIN